MAKAIGLAVGRNPGKVDPRIERYPTDSMRCLSRDIEVNK